MRKIINVNNPGNITPRQEKAIMDAFERYEGEVEIRVPQVEHLQVSRQKGACCDHQWKPAPKQDDVSKWFQQNFEEQCDPGVYCSKCGATGLVEEMTNRLGVAAPIMWAYDATSRFFGKVPKERKHDQEGRKEKRR